MPSRIHTRKLFIKDKQIYFNVFFLSIMTTELFNNYCIFFKLHLAFILFYVNIVNMYLV